MVVARIVRAGRARAGAVDATVAIVLAVSAIVLMRLTADDIRQYDPTFTSPGWGATLVAALIPTVPLAWRRRWPLVVAPLVCGGLVVGRLALDIAEGAATVLAAYLAIYSAALHGRRPWRVPVVSMSVAAVLAEIVREIFFVDDGGPIAVWIQVFSLVYNVVILALPWWLGEAMRLRSVRERELLARTIELSREREENAQRAVFEERVRIARELHDVVAHHVSTMGIQAAAARRVMERRPDQARIALESIEEASRQAVGEMHQLLGFLRRDEQPDGVAPQPGMGDLDDLIAQLAAAGLSVDLVTDGAPAPISATIELSLYRIIQEALTNVLKHSGGSTATVRIAWANDSVEVEVRDRGRGATAHREHDRDGHGLTGMRERAGLHGGELHAGGTADGGFVVRVRIPLAGRQA